MFGLLFLLVGVAGVAAFGLLDDSDASPEKEVDGADLDAKAPLLDEGEMARLDAKLAEDPLLENGAVGPEGDVLLPYKDENGFAYVEGTDGADLISLPEEIGSNHDPIFAGGGKDVGLGNSDDNVAFGRAGNDILFGRGGNDQLFGDDGNDTMSGGGGADLIVGGLGSDVIYGGAGNDAIHDNYHGAPPDSRSHVDIIAAGDGDDGVIVQDGINLVSLGAGRDHVTVYGETDENPAAVITDFDPGSDALLLGVYAPGIALPAGKNGIELPYTLREIETDLGPATLVQPAGTDDIAPGDLGNGASVGYAVLVGVRPDELDGADIRVVLNTPDTDPFAPGSVEAVAKGMGATRL